MRSLIVYVLLLVGPAARAADSRSFDIDHLQLALTGGDFLTTESAGRLFPWGWHAGAAYRFLDQPLLLRHADGSVETLVGARSMLEVSGAVDFTRWFAVGVALPVLLDQHGSAAPTGAALGDLRLVPRFDLLRRAHVGFATLLGLRVPTGATDRFVGEGMVVFEPRFAVEGYLGPRDLVRLGANLGFRLRDPRTYRDLDVGQEIFASLALAIVPLPFLDVLAELHATTALSTEFGQARQSPVELLIGLGGGWRGFHVQAAAGFGLVDGYGQPRARALLSVEYRRPPPPAPAPTRVIAMRPLPVPPPAPPPPPPKAVEPAKEEPPTPEEPSVSFPLGRIELADRIFFDTDRKRIHTRYRDELDQLARAINRRTNIRLVWIEGHADAIGPERWNLELSRLRAEEVAKYLVKRGVAPDRLRPVGFGEARPLVPTPYGARSEKNRRVHFYTDGESTPPAPPTASVETALAPPAPGGGAPLDEEPAR